MEENIVKQSRKEFMDQKKTESLVGFHKFMLKFPRNNNLPICFVEGEDEKYYSLRVKMNCDNHEPIFISCGGKAGVINIYVKISEKSEYSKGKIFYFIDRDFDPLVNNPKIYETSCYSVENFYTTNEAISNITRNIFKIDESDADYNLFCSLIQARHREFHNATLLLNAWIMCQREVIEKSRINLKTIKLNDLLKITLDRVEQTYGLHDIENLFPQAQKISAEVLDNKMKEIDNSSFQSVFRGKFELYFLAKILEIMQEELGRKTNSIFLKKKKVKLNFYDILSQFSTFASTPIELYSYIRKTWSSIERTEMQV